MTSTPVPARRSLLVLVAVIALLVVVSLVVVFTRGEPEQLDESTPEGVVQRYSAAVLDGDEDAALGYLAKEARVDCGTIHTMDDLRVAHVSTEESADGDTVDVTVSLGRPSSGIFDGSSYEYEDTFVLVSDGDEWRVLTAPWDRAFCRTDVNGFVECPARRSRQHGTLLRRDRRRGRSCDGWLCTRSSSPWW